MTGEVTDLLQQWQAGNRSAEARLFEVIHPELRRIARVTIKAGRRDPTVHSAGLVNELYLRLVKIEQRDFPNRRAFFAYAAKAMRNIVISSYRRHPKIVVVTGDISAQALSREEKIVLILAIHAVLDALKEEHPDWHMVVELKFFLGLTNAAVAEAMGIPLRTVERMWEDARWWLFQKLGPEPWRPSPPAARRQRNVE